MKRNEPVKKIMSTDLITAHPKNTFSEISEKVKNNKIHHLPVVSGAKLIGILSVTDFMHYSFGSTFGVSERQVNVSLDHSISIEDIMQKEIKTVSPEDTIRTAAEILSSGDFHSLPVVKDGDLVGIVTTTDLIRYLLDQY